MSFHVEYHARSRNHALQTLEVYKSSLPDSVFSFVRTAIINAYPSTDCQRIFKIKAVGHLCASGDSGNHSSATIEVTRIDIPD